MNVVGLTNKTITPRQIERASTLGLGGVQNSLSYRLGEIDRHIHSMERWYGSTAGVAPGLQTSLTGFRLTSDAAANTFGVAVAVFNGVEVMGFASTVFYDLHKLLVLNVQNNAKTYRIRLAFSDGVAYANYAAAVAAGCFTDVCVKIDNTALDATPIFVQMRRMVKTTKIWAAVATADAVAQWIDFIVGLHEYEG
jgi:hypothetical protein